MKRRVRLKNYIRYWKENGGEDGWEFYILKYLPENPHEGLTHDLEDFYKNHLTSQVIEVEPWEGYTFYYPYCWYDDKGVMWVIDKKMIDYFIDD